MIRIETKDVIEVFRVNGMTELAEHVATLERERDEARDLYQRMRQAVAGDGTYGDASQLLAKWGFVNHPEWRKDGA